jgi:phosphate transport system substrate-binding protein
LKSGEEVIDYVNKNGNCIGLIGAGWISDRDDSTANAFLNKFKVMEILSKEDGEYYKPFQAYLALRSYPLTRTVYYLLREPRTGLGTGFSNFLASDKGQRIVLKSGLVPATMPVRLVKVKKSAQER